jgi:hypothetical protein
MVHLLQEINHLPIAERMLLAHVIVDNAIAEAQAAPVTAEQLAAIRQCDSDAEAGNVKCSSLEDVLHRLFREQ